MVGSASGAHSSDDDRPASDTLQIPWAWLAQHGPALARLCVYVTAILVAGGVAAAIYFGTRPTPQPLMGTLGTIQF